MRLYIVVILWLCVLPLFSNAQSVEKKRDTAVFGEFKGTQQYNIVNSNSVVQKFGDYYFSSDVKPFLLNDAIYLKELNIAGKFFKNQKGGVWNYKFNNFKLNDLKLKFTTNVSLKYDLNGISSEYKIGYNNGQFNGKALFTTNEIKNNRSFNPIQKLSVIYKSDTIVGSFFVDNDEVTISGRTDELGFLDGDLIFEYNQNNVPIVERRVYKKGFLLLIEKKYTQSDSVYLKLEFDDVKTMLNQIEQNVEGLAYKVSDTYFGLKFNIGYQQIDKRVTEQLYGNYLLKQQISIFDSIHNMHNGTTGEGKSIFKFTNRFEYLYDENETPFITELANENKDLNTKLAEVLNKPNIAIRKDISDTLLRQYIILQHLKGLSDTIQQVFDKIESGYFSYRSRDKYFSSGIAGLRNIDTLSVVRKEDTFALPFILEMEHQKFTNDFEQIKAYIFAINNKAKSTIFNISERLNIYERQEEIDSLDAEISMLQTNIDLKYVDYEKYASLESSKVPFSYKLFNSLNDRTLAQLKTKYLNNSLSQNEMIALGTNLLSYYQFLDSNKVYLDAIGQFQSKWNDSLFTRYRENPFDFRMLETKVLEGVQSAANILLRNYAVQLLNAKTAEQLQMELGKIQRLEQRVLYIVNNKEPEKVRQLNKSLRRERVPIRIERILSL